MRTVRDSNPWTPPWQGGMITNFTNNPFELPSGIEPNYLDYKSSASPAMLWKQFRKEEDGSVDNFFYDWRYYDSSNSDDINSQPLPGISHHHSPINLIRRPNHRIVASHRVELKSSPWKGDVLTIRRRGHLLFQRTLQIYNIYL